MAVLIDTRTGFFPQSDGSGDTPMRQSKMSALVTGMGQPRYFEQTSRGNMCFAATTAGITTTVGLSTTYTGLVVSNPIGNSKLMVLNKISYSWTVISTSVTAVGLAVGYSPTVNVTHTTPNAVKNSLFGTGPSPTMLADVSAGLSAVPFYYMFLGDTGTATTNPPGGFFDLESALVIPPGGFVMAATTQATPGASFFGSFSWEEIPILS